MSSLPTRILRAAVAAVFLGALVTRVVDGSRSPQTMDPGTPEAAVQGYLDAVLEREGKVASGFLAADSACDADDIDDAYVDEDLYVALRTTVVDGPNASVGVTVTTGSGGLFPTTWNEDHTFLLTRHDGVWLLSGSPWPMFGCGVVFP